MGLFDNAVRVNPLSRPASRFPEKWEGKIEKGLVLNYQQKHKVIHIGEMTRKALRNGGLDLEGFRIAITSIRRELHSRQPDLKHRKDFADVDREEFSYMLKQITDLQELIGLANRQKVLNAPRLKKYSRWQKKMILQRRWELKHDL